MRGGAHELHVAARLIAVKLQYDPTNFFRVNQNLDPAAVAGV